MEKIKNILKYALKPGFGLSYCLAKNREQLICCLLFKNNSIFTLILLINSASGQKCDSHYFSPNTNGKLLLSQVYPINP